MSFLIWFALNEYTTYEYSQKFIADEDGKMGDEK
jgi:hypothetical protein